MKPSILEVPPPAPNCDRSSPGQGSERFSPVTPRTLVGSSASNPSSPKHSLLSVTANTVPAPKREPPVPTAPLQGWPQLALLMDQNPDLAAFARFRELNIKSLLYYQAELTILRRKLFEQEWDDAGKGEKWAEYADDLVQSGSEQYGTVKEIRKVLKEYNKALLQFSQVCALPDPEPFNMRTLRRWLRNGNGGDFRVCGDDGLENTWGEVYQNPEESLRRQFQRLVGSLLGIESFPDNERDLAVTTPAMKVDGLTRWVATEFYPFCRAVWNRLKGGKTTREDLEAKHKSGAQHAPAERLPWDKSADKEETLVSWSEKGALKATSVLSTVIACLLPVIAIAILSQLHGLNSLLGCLAGFVALFAIVLIFLTRGTSSRTEIFAATAAFAAVMVVFISQPPAPVIMMGPGSPIPSVSPSPTLAP